jgi:hypothetical protein
LEHDEHLIYLSAYFLLITVLHEEEPDTTIHIERFAVFSLSFSLPLSPAEEEKESQEE